MMRAILHSGMLIKREIFLIHSFAYALLTFTEEEI